MTRSFTKSLRVAKKYDGTIHTLTYEVFSPPCNSQLCLVVALARRIRILKFSLTRGLNGNLYPSGCETGLIASPKDHGDLIRTSKRNARIRVRPKMESFEKSRLLHRSKYC
ncbi:hypothetical protein TNCV_3941821 [Trichonephila clavipes]|uniref:Uncharacterized protein n=1 Tax=Trichonephila clavipes TaxID=2585209 RepID=A0A8X7B8J0_TRICX|nr:hypothetical protein TNCV_3941821 [Trichonephila clavipes]